MARRVVPTLTFPERVSLLMGGHFGMHRPEEGFYVGNTPAIARVGVPPLKMQDASNGFRTTQPSTEGTTTVWPCMLALASTWDEDIVGKVAAAIAMEFRKKGANMLLGPGLNVQRNADNGRSFEYLSGEDPYLGSRLAHTFITSVQGEGVIATVKHFAFNQKETNRKTISVNVDLKTAWEIYYPPFQAAVDAGVASVMCSYNKVNGSWACGNDDILQRDLKGRMGFKGFVISDWQATHDTNYIAQGLDQEMPGPPRTNNFRVETLNSMYSQATAY